MKITKAKTLIVGLLNESRFYSESKNWTFQLIIQLLVFLLL